MEIQRCGLWWGCTEDKLSFLILRECGNFTGFTEQEAKEIAPQVAEIFRGPELPFEYGYKKVSAAGSEFYVKLSHSGMFSKTVELPRLKNKSCGKTLDTSKFYDPNFIEELLLA